MHARGKHKTWEKKKKTLPDGESNPGLPRDRRGYSPLYYQGRASNSSTLLTFKVSHARLQCGGICIVSVL